MNVPAFNDALGSFLLLWPMLKDFTSTALKYIFVTTTRLYSPLAQIQSNHAHAPKPSWYT